MTAGRKASRPPRGWEPETALDPLTLRLTLWPEDAPADGYVIDATTWAGPTSLRLDMLKGIAVLGGAAGPWRRQATIYNGMVSTRRFIRWIDDWTDPNLPAGTARPDSLADLSRGVWAAWVATCNRGSATKRVAMTIAAIAVASPALPASGAHAPASGCRRRCARSPAWRSTMARWWT